MSHQNGNNKKEALRNYVGLARLQITLALGVVALSATFLAQSLGKSVGQGTPNWLMFASWSLFIVSVVFGLFFHGRAITLMSESDYNVDDAMLDWFGRVQQVTLCLGVVLFTIFAALKMS